MEVKKMRKGGGGEIVTCHHAARATEWRVAFAAAERGPGGSIRVIGPTFEKKKKESKKVELTNRRAGLDSMCTKRGATS